MFFRQFSEDEQDEVMEDLRIIILNKKKELRRNK